MHHRSWCAATLLLALAGSSTFADMFGSGENAFEIPFVTVGSPGNAPDTTGAPNPAGSVGYTYRIGKFEVPEEAVRKANAQSELDGDPLNITLDDRGPQKPATGLSWFEAARFVNWLNEDAGFGPAYKFDDQGAFQLWEPTDPGYNPNNLFRNRNARYVLPSVDEWYKAAFYDPLIDAYWDYPTGSDDPPIPVASGTDPGTAVWNQTTGPADIALAGGASPYGTVGQGGNVTEWQESPTSGAVQAPPVVTVRSIRGDNWGLAVNADGLSSIAVTDRLADFPSSSVGFRILAVPEPISSSLIICVLTWGCLIRIHAAACSRQAV